MTSCGSTIRCVALKSIKPFFIYTNFVSDRKTEITTAYQTRFTEQNLQGSVTGCRIFNIRPAETTSAVSVRTESTNVAFDYEVDLQVQESENSDSSTILTDLADFAKTVYENTDADSVVIADLKADDSTDSSGTGKILWNLSALCLLKFFS